MRDPNRIDEYIEVVRKVWKKYPDLRFTQMILNIFGNNPADYYLEDEESIERLSTFYGVNE